LIWGLSFAQQPHSHAHNRVIHFPDVPGYKSIITDFHIHTVFSDGSVWPDIRIQEALRDSVHAISLTEHLEYEPHKEEIPNPDRNHSYVLGEKYARPYRLMVIKGAEITRDMPPGHNNAIFIEDANKLEIADSVEVFREARRQDAFVFWNHPNWVAQVEDGIARLTDMHRLLIKENLLHGIEVVNDLTYSDEALQIALDNNLAIMGTSDIHGLVDYQFNIADGGHRPVTIVFGQEKTPEGIKEGLFARRTVAYFKNTLIGRSEHLIPLLNASLTVEKAGYQGKADVVDVKIKNHSSVEYILGNRSEYSLHANTDIVIIPPYETVKIEVKTLERYAEFELAFEVLNTVIASNTHPTIRLKIETE